MMKQLSFSSLAIPDYFSWQPNVSDKFEPKFDDLVSIGARMLFVVFFGHLFLHLLKGILLFVMSRDWRAFCNQ